MGAPSHRNDYTSIYDQRCAAWGNEETIDLLYLWRDNLQAIQCARNRPAWEHVSTLDCFSASAPWVLMNFVF